MPGREPLPIETKHSGTGFLEITVESPAFARADPPGCRLAREPLLIFGGFGQVLRGRQQTAGCRERKALDRHFL